MSFPIPVFSSLLNALQPSFKFTIIPKLFLSRLLLTLQATRSNSQFSALDLPAAFDTVGHPLLSDTFSRTPPTLEVPFISHHFYLVPQSLFSMYLVVYLLVPRLRLTVLKCCSVIFCCLWFD